MEDCRKLGVFPAQITNDRTRFSFSIAILKKQIISPAVRDLLSKLKLQLDAEETALLSYLVSYNSLSLPMAKAITGKSGEMTSGILAKLEDIQVVKFTGYKQAWSLSEDMVQKIAEVSAELETDQVTRQATDQAGIHASMHADEQATDQAQLSEHIVMQRDMLETEPDPDHASMHAGMHADQATGQVTGQAQNEQKRNIDCLVEALTQVQIGIIRTCAVPANIQEMTQRQNLVNRNNLRKRHLKPLLEQGVVLMEYPDKPKHPRQRYYLRLKFNYSGWSRKKSLRGTRHFKK